MTQRVLDVCDAVGGFIEWWGFKAIHGRIWVLLAVSERALSQVELAEMLGVSRSLISGAVAELAGYGLVEAVSEHHHAPYRASIDVWSTISDVLRTREGRILERIRAALAAAVQEGNRSRKQGRPSVFDLARLRLLLRMTELAQTLLRMLIAIGGARTPRGLAGWVERALALTHDLRSGQETSI